MKIHAIYLDGGPALTDTLQNDSILKRKELLKESLYAPAGQANFLVTRSSEDFLKNQGLIPETAAIEVITMSNPTQGALATALLPIELIAPKEPILLIPTNSVVNANALSDFVSKMIKDGVAAGALLFRSDNPDFSYARIHNNRVIEFIEKKVVGDMATTGVFYFRDKVLVLECAKWAFVNSQITNSQFFVAPSLNYVLTSGQEVGFSQIDEAKYEHI
ncbi:hypothetical protein MCERE3_00062 [Candidatus Nanopelagicaceae bacterium]